MRDIKIVDVTGDHENIIIRIFGEDEKPKGLWFGKDGDGSWNCLHDDIDKEFAGLVFQHENVQKKLAGF